MARVIHERMIISGPAPWSTMLTISTDENGRGPRLDVGTGSTNIEVDLVDTNCVIALASMLNRAQAHVQKNDHTRITPYIVDGDDVLDRSNYAVSDSSIKSNG